MSEAEVLLWPLPSRRPAALLLIHNFRSNPVVAVQGPSSGSKDSLVAGRRLPPSDLKWQPSESSRHRWPVRFDR